MAMQETPERALYEAQWERQNEYSAENIGYTPHFLRFMQRWTHGINAKPICALEVGCGDGFFSSKLHGMGCKITGIDFSEVALNAARQRCPDGEFRTHDLNNPLPFEDASFDLVWCSEVLEHLVTPLFVLQQVRRVLKPGGLALLTTPYHGLLKNIGIALFAFDRHYDPEYFHIRFYTIRSLGNLVRKAGMQIREVSTCGSSIAWRDWLVPTNILIAAQRPA